MSKKNQHVVPHGDEWAVKVEGSSEVTQVFATQTAAIAFGREQAIKYQSELFIHNQKGQIRERNTYGNDPYPPKG
jgi:hypothetical protein